jgi:hypothetical protein
MADCEFCQAGPCLECLEAQELSELHAAQAAAAWQEFDAYCQARDAELDRQAEAAF